MKNYSIPRTLDDPKLFFIWEIDTGMVFLITLILSSLLLNSGIGAVVSFLISCWATRYYGRLKEEGGNGLIVKLLYWYCPSEILQFKHLTSCKRELYG